MVEINFFSSSLSTTHANRPLEKRSKDFLPDFAATGDFNLNSYPLVTLISFLIFSAGLKLTNNLESSLLNFFEKKKNIFFFQN